MIIHLPKLGLVDNRQTRMHIEEIFPDKLIERSTRWHSKTSLEIEVLDILLRNLGEPGEFEKWVE
jgi:hypothetical protein